jgi:hypothetical protein
MASMRSCRAHCKEGEWGAWLLGRSDPPGGNGIEQSSPKRVRRSQPLFDLSRNASKLTTLTQLSLVRFPVGTVLQIYQAPLMDVEHLRVDV